MRVAVVWRLGWIVAEDAEEVLRESDRDRAERRRANDHELRPPEEKTGESPPPFPQEHINAAGMRICARDLCESQRAAHRQRSTNDPHREQRQRTR